MKFENTLAAETIGGYSELSTDARLLLELLTRGLLDDGKKAEASVASLLFPLQNECKTIADAWRVVEGVADELKDKGIIESYWRRTPNSILVAKFSDALAETVSSARRNGFYAELRPKLEAWGYFEDGEDAE